MNKGPKVFAASLLFGYLYWRSLKPSISIINKDSVAGSVTFSMSVDGSTFTDTIFLTDDKSIILAEDKKHWFITEPDEDRTGVNLSIAENLQPGGAYDVLASEWVRVTPFAAIGGGDLKLKKISKKEAEEVWNNDNVVYVKTAPGKPDSLKNLFAISTHGNDAALNMYTYGLHPKSFGFDRTIKFIKDRTENNLSYYTLYSPVHHIIDYA